MKRLALEHTDVKMAKVPFPSQDISFADLWDKVKTLDVYQGSIMLPC